MLTASMDTFLKQLDLKLAPGMLEMLAGMITAMLAAMLVVALITYVLNAIGLYSIAKRRGFYHPWLAWLPLCRDWLLGAIGDRYQLACKYHVTIKGPGLVIMKIAAYALNAATVMSYQKLSKNVESLMSWVGKKVTEWQYNLYIMPLEQQIASTKSFLNIVGILALVATVIYVVVYYRAHYDLFTSCRPDLKVVFLVLGILFPVTMPFFVFACRKRDDGMPQGQPDAGPQIINSPAE